MLGCFAMIIASFLPGTCFLLTSTVSMVWQPIALSRQVAQYHTGQCTILSKTLLSFPNIKGTVYAAHFTYTVHTSEGKNYQASGYGPTQVETNDKIGQQAIIDSYQVGANAPCWYDPAQPSHAILNKDAFGPLLIPFILGLIFSILITLTSLLMLFLLVVFVIIALSPTRPSGSPNPSMPDKKL